MNKTFLHRDSGRQACAECSSAFDVTQADLAFYDKVSPVFNGKKEAIPAPTFCPPCRRQRRLAFRNERHLYHRKCDLTGKQIISQYKQSALKAYATGDWWGDGWDALKYGRDVDFSRPFFEQFAELISSVPHPAVANDLSNQNSDYANQTGLLKNCYLVYDSDECDDCYYVQTGKKSTSCSDCLRPLNSQLCYECVDCVKCYHTLYSQNCDNCYDSFFLFDCKGCSNCFCCSGLRNKKHCMFNEQLTESEYAGRIAELHTGSGAALEHAKRAAEKWMQNRPRRALNMTSCEESIGDFLINTQNAHMCFDCSNIRDCTHCTNLSEGAEDCMDYDVWGYRAQLLYEVMTSGYDTSRLLFCNDCWGSTHDMLYCDACFHSAYLFGCVGLKKNEYCILNKQYSKEEYQALVPKIIKHMRSGGEWGEFFPISSSLFAYNESVAQEYFPLTESEVRKRGWQWHEEEDRKRQYLGPTYIIPDDIRDVSDDILKQILTCDVSKKPYKIIPQELKFYREMNVPIPRRCPDQRHKERMALRNPRKLWSRRCAGCSSAIETTYAPTRPEVIYCEKCYLSNIL